MSNNRQQIIHEFSEMRQVTASVLKLLRPVEKELEFLLRDVINARQHFSVNISNEKVLLQEINADITTAITKARGNLRIRRDLRSLFFTSIDAYLIAVEAAAKVGIEATTKQMQLAAYQLTLMRFADGLSRLSTFYSHKLGVATLAAVPLMMTIWLEDDPIDTLDRMIEEGFIINDLGDAARDTEDVIGNMVIDIFREKMTTVGIPALGGNYTAPITNTGNLAASLGILKGETQRRYRRGAIAKNMAHQINIGMMPNAPGRVNIYGNILNKTFSSRPPKSDTSRDFFAASWGNFKIWGAKRGIEDENLRRIIAKIWSRGTYGRNWFSVIVQNITDIDVPEQLMIAFEQRLQKSLDKI